MSQSKLDYLQKYLKPGASVGGGDGLRVRKETLEKKSKKKRKKNLEQAGGFLVRDEDELLPAAGVGAKQRKKKRKINMDNVDGEDEDAPLVVGGAISVDGPGAVPVDTSGGSWAVSKQEAARGTMKRELTKERHDSDSDLDVRRAPARHDSDDDISPRRGASSSKPAARHDSDDDMSPPRGRPARHDSDDDISPKRGAAKRHDSDDDMSPKRGGSSPKRSSSPKRVKKERHDSDSDMSPVRRKPTRHDSDDGDLSPARNNAGAAKRHDSDSDLEPPRNATKRHDSDDDDDLEPPRNNAKRHDSDDDSDLDVRRDTRKRHDSDDDMSPARNQVKKERHDSDSEEDEKAKKRKRKEEKKKRREEKANKAQEKMSSGMSAGLIQAQSIQAEVEANRLKRLERIKEESDELTGKGAATVYRSKGGTQIDKNQYAEQNQRKARREIKQQDVTWGGEKQRESKEEEDARLQKLAEGPFARHDIDDDYNLELKNRLRVEDPMAKAMMEEQEREARLKSNRPKCRFPMPPNRFNIEPGYRWDGKFRGIGWEKKWIERKTKMERDKKRSYTSAITDM